MDKKEKELQIKDETPVPEGGPSLSRKRRLAVVIYLGLLFIMAFVVVAVSLISENNKNAANEKAATAMEKAEALQEENRTLRSDLTESQAKAEALALECQSAQTTQTAMEAELRQTQAALNELADEAKDRAETYDLLLSALNAWQQGDGSGFRTAMERLRPKAAALTGEAKTTYDLLLRVLNTPEE